MAYNQKDMANMADKIIKSMAAKKSTKYEYAYQVGMMDCHNVYGTVWVDHNKKAEVVAEFERLARTERQDRVAHLHD